MRPLRSGKKYRSCCKRCLTGRGKRRREKDAAEDSDYYTPPASEGIRVPRPQASRRLAASRAKPNTQIRGAPVTYSSTVTGVSRRTILSSLVAFQLASRKHPCDSVLPMSPG
jgi:hypothetical protein